ncbi:MAG: NCS2 family permease, partial [Verrucomicrobiota bacterium]
TGVKLNPELGSPDVLVFFVGLITAAALHTRKVRGSILIGILAATGMAVVLKWILPHLPEGYAQSKMVAESMLAKQFQIAGSLFAAPPSLAPTFLKMDVRNALSLAMLPFVIIFFFMVLFDTVGTLVGIGEQGGFIKDNKLPRAKEAFVSDALGTTLGACLGTSTVTSYIESAAGVEQGGRTGLTSLTTAGLFLLALFVSPVVAMVGSYPPITAPALVLVGAMMIRSVVKIEWNDPSESLPAFLTLLGIPLTFSIADGLALGFISYPVIKVLTGKQREVRWLMYVVAVVLAFYFLFIRSRIA